MSCAMVCGAKNIWPMPTGKLALSSRSLTFKSNQLQLEVKTTFSEAKQLMNSAYDVFLFDLRSLEDRHAHAHASSQTDLDKNDNNQFNKEKMAADHRNNDNGHAGSKTNSVKAKLDENANQNCDINKITIIAEIHTSGDAFLHMESDESYELNVTSNNQSDMQRSIQLFHDNFMVLCVISFQIPIRIYTFN